MTARKPVEYVEEVELQVQQVVQGVVLLQIGPLHIEQVLLIIEQQLGRGVVGEVQFVFLLEELQ